MTDKLLKISRILLVSALIALGTNTGDAQAIVECKQESIDEAKLQKEGFSAEEISKMQQLKKAEYEFCMAKKAVADKDTKDRNLNSEAGNLEPQHFTAEGEGRSNVKFSDVTAASSVADLKKKYPDMMQNLIDKAQAVNNLMDGTPCGSDYPYGCPPGTACYSTSISLPTSINFTLTSNTSYTTYDCKNSHDRHFFSNKATSGAEGDSLTVTNYITGDATTVTTDSEGNTHIEKNNISDIKIKRGNNSACSIPDMQNMYQSTCYSCKIIMTLITTFMNACGKVYDLTREAGSKVLVIGSMLWLAAFALKLVSAFTNQEPMSILNTLLIFMFKVASAYIVINVGIGAIVDLFINPLLLAGADYGLGLLQAANQGIIKVALTSNFTYNGTEIISPVVINKIMALTEGIDKTVSTNLVIGHALTCHSFNAGMLEYTGGLFGVNVTIRIPDLWIWLCGAAIWFCGFMLTLGIGYYLLDVCFKIGFCIMALPIVIGLWPFGPTSGKFTSCMSIIFRSAALFAFLALTTSYALSLISVSLGDLTTFYAKIQAGDAEWISNTFSITGAKFILIMFAYIYSIKMIGATVTGYVGKFFNDSTFGDADPIHKKATQMTDFAKSKVTQAASFAGGVVTRQTTRLVGAVAGGMVNTVKRGINKAKSGGAASSGMNAAGKGMETAGKGMEAAGKGVEAAGKGISAAGKGIASASQAANAIPIAGQVIAGAGAAVGAATQAAGAATQAAGKATQAAGKATKAAGKATKAAAKGVEKVEQGIDAVKSTMSNDSNEEKD